jgi:ankyrin repeat protein
VVITDVLYAAKYGTYGEFLSWYGRPGGADAGEVLISAVLGRQDEGERRRIVRRLLDDGADPNFASPRGEDGLMLCLKYGARDWSAEGLAWVTRELLSAGLDVARRDRWGNDALMLAVCNTRQPSGELEPVWRELLGAGADPTVPGPQGKTTLDWAREFGWRRDFLGVAAEYGYGEGE